MAYLLFPGRHLLTTSFQQEYLSNILHTPINKLDILGKYSGEGEDKIDHIIFAVTSANQENSRYNPVPFHWRCLNLYQFSNRYRDVIGTKIDILSVPHFDPSENFSKIVIKEISEDTENQLQLNPSNTIVLCSTPSVLELYSKMGYAVLSAEYDNSKNKFISKIPIEYIKRLVEVGEDWQKDPVLIKGLSQATQELWKNFSGITKKIIRLWKDPLLNEEGSLTETRNYSSYAYGMGHFALLQSKFNDIKKVIIPGKIVDEGCADGALMTLLAKEFPDSDLIGIELTSEFTARFLERQRAGEFGGTFVHIHQRNLMERIFENNSIDTTICNSTTHEIWSYGEGEKSLKSYLRLKYDQLRKNGRLIIRDVVGPYDKNKEIYMELNTEDGLSEDVFKVCDDRESLEKHIMSLSTYAKFLRFTKDYLKDLQKSGRKGEESEIKFKEEIIGDKKFIVTSLKNASEFMTKKDYVDNWKSELNEEFAFWTFDEWKKAMMEVGFRIVENPNEPDKSSRAFNIPWVVQNRFKDKVYLFEMRDEGLVSIDYPVTNMVLIGEKL